MGKIVLDVKGMTCQHCVHAVTMAIQSVDGTEDIEVYLESGQAEFFIEDEANIDQVKEAIHEAGYQV
ncbi:MAG TPA: copper chaperone [Caldithrix abyssi]|uniref:Copper chaperone n=1 Tax=Caldithrix abyssi TaxID=187145 RepID=A0A7V5LKC1_CALAY|nr:heavy-metal-associated domain-containing protein [Caldisericaceae bacterium]HHE55795.1 copper chaperone [Caldithrix abyssi]